MKRLPTSLNKDTGLHCLLLLARFHGVPADGAQLQHQFGEADKVLSDANLLRAAKHLGLKAARMRSRWEELSSIPLPAIAKRSDGRYVVVAKVEGERILVQDTMDERPTVLTRPEFESTWSADLVLIAKRSGLSLAGSHLRLHMVHTGSGEISASAGRSVDGFFLSPVLCAIDTALYPSGH